MDNPYEAPQAAFASRIADLQESVGKRRPIASFDTQTLQKLVSQSQTISGVGGYLLLFSGVLVAIMTLILSIEGPFHDVLSLSLAGCGIAGVFAAVGILRRTTWGRYAGILTCGSILLGIVVLFADQVGNAPPDQVAVRFVGVFIVSLFGLLPVLGLRHFIQRPEFFGPDRYDHETLVNELLQRRLSGISQR